MPCCADDECREDASRGTDQSAEKPTKEECPGCSPFYACGSCAGFILPKDSAEAVSTERIQNRGTYIQYLTPKAQDIITSIWQPPQLS